MNLFITGQNRISWSGPFKECQIHLDNWVAEVKSKQDGYVSITGDLYQHAGPDTWEIFYYYRRI